MLLEYVNNPNLEIHGTPKNADHSSTDIFDPKKGSAKNLFIVSCYPFAVSLNHKKEYEKAGIAIPDFKFVDLNGGEVTKDRGRPTSRESNRKGIIDFIEKEAKLKK